MSVVPSYVASKSLLNPIGFSKIGGKKLVFSAQLFIHKLAESWEMFEKSKNKKITKI